MRTDIARFMMHKGEDGYYFNGDRPRYFSNYVIKTENNGMYRTRVYYENLEEYTAQDVEHLEIDGKGTYYTAIEGDEAYRYLTVFPPTDDSDMYAVYLPKITQGRDFGAIFAKMINSTQEMQNWDEGEIGYILVEGG